MAYPDITNNNITQIIKSLDNVGANVISNRNTLHRLEEKNDKQMKVILGLLVVPLVFKLSIYGYYTYRGYKVNKKSKIILSQDV